MNRNQIQSFRQEQKRIMTTEMQLSLKILQMPIIELQQYVSIELQENPVLDSEDEGSSLITDDLEKISDFKQISDFSTQENLLKQIEHSKGFEENLYRYAEPAEDNSPFNYIEEKKSLKDYLKEQLMDLRESRKVYFVCEYIIESLDHRGYLEYGIEDIAKDLNVSKAIAEYSLSIIQSLEPKGVGARNLKECLKIQLKAKGKLDENINIIIESYLELVAKNKLKEISRKLNLDIQIVQRYSLLIKSLEPKPSRGFYTGGNTNYITPEAFIKKVGDEYFIILNDSMLPRLNINHSYKEIINNERNNEAIEYIKDKINRALFLVKGIEQRKNTLYNILNCIVDIQKDYFDHGKDNLKPMYLRDIAQLLNIHESTVSRAIKDKYISTPTGIVKIKDLFTVGVSSLSEDEKISSSIIKNEIKKLIDMEDNSKPLSDQMICDRLNTIGIKVSRRTIVKYRDELGIKSSIIRKVINID